MNLLPCPFCGSTSIDAEGWASTERAGPACDDCAGTADTVELWNSRPVAADRIATLEAALRSIASKCPVTCDMTLAHEMAEEAEAALAPEQEK